MTVSSRTPLTPYSIAMTRVVGQRRRSANWKSAPWRRPGRILLPRGAERAVTVRPARQSEPQVEAGIERNPARLGSVHPCKAARAETIRMQRLRRGRIYNRYGAPINRRRTTGGLEAFASAHIPDKSANRPARLRGNWDRLVLRPSAHKAFQQEAARRN